jgi:hypothetical protein
VDLKEIKCEGVDWIHLARVRVHWPYRVNRAMNFRVPSKTENFMTS